MASSCEVPVTRISIGQYRHDGNIILAANKVSDEWPRFVAVAIKRDALGLLETRVLRLTNAAAVDALPITG